MTKSTQSDLNEQKLPDTSSFKKPPKNICTCAHACVYGDGGGGYRNSKYVNVSLQFISIVLYNLHIRKLYLFIYLNT